MNIQRILLTITVFTVAIGGAVASKSFGSGDGYTNEAQIPDQGAPCMMRKYCAGGTTTCTVLIAGITYNLNVKNGTTCPIVLSLTQP